MAAATATCSAGTLTVCADTNAVKNAAADTTACDGGTACTALKDLGTCCTAKTGYEITGTTGSFAVAAATEAVCKNLAAGAKKFCQTPQDPKDSGNWYRELCKFTSKQAEACWNVDTEDFVASTVCDIAMKPCDDASGDDTYSCSEYASCSTRCGTKPSTAICSTTGPSANAGTCVAACSSCTKFQVAGDTCVVNEACLASSNVCADPNVDQKDSEINANCVGAACTAAADLGTCCTAKPGFNIAGSTGSFTVAPNQACSAGTATVCADTNAVVRFHPLFVPRLCVVSNENVLTFTCSFCVLYSLLYSVSNIAKRCGRCHQVCWCHLYCSSRS